MAQKTKILTVVGARPQFVKAAAVSRAIAARDDAVEVMVHTGQHFDENMSDIFFSDLGIAPPAHALKLGGGSHGAMTGRMLECLEQIILQEKPDHVLVYGDTNSTIAGALAAAKLHVPVVHVEAGLRSFNRAMPEELNRVLTDHVSDLLLCPSRTAVDNLAREGITKGVHHVGDVMYDAAVDARERAAGRSEIMRRLSLEDDGFVLATVHRAENTDNRDRLVRVIETLREAAAGLPLVLPLHPRTAKAVATHGLSLDGLTVCDPVGYLDMTMLLSRCRLVMTDSGGVQKEAYFHRRPCITLRDETEWVETVAAGWNRLWTEPDYATPRRDITDYGDGRAAQRAIDLVLGASAHS